MLPRVRHALAATAAAVVTTAALVAPATAATPEHAGRSSDSPSGSPQQSVRASCVAPRCFGAISFNKRTGVAGLFNERDGRRKAVRLAQRNCKAKSREQFGSPGQCTPAGSVQNGCMAVAFRVDGEAIVQWTTKFGHTKREAKRAAYAAVDGPGERFYAAWLCTTRHY